MDLSAFQSKKTSRRKPRRLGRGHGSGWGKTAGRGHKGQKARSGGYHKREFEGGQMPLSRRIPKWGFTNIFQKRYQICNIDKLGAFKDGDVVDPESLEKLGVVEAKKDPIKILGDGELKVKLTVKAHRFSRSAEEKIKAAGGQIEVLK